MSRFLLALIATLTALTFTLALSARAWGEAQPPHPALRGFVEGCEAVPQPCWFGISIRREEILPLDFAEQKLIQRGYVVGDDLPPIEGIGHYRNYRPTDVEKECDVELAYIPETGRVIRLNLDCRNVNLEGGDLLAILGIPDGSGHSTFSYINPSIVVYVASSLNLRSSLHIIQLPSAYQSIGFSWQGLMPGWKHCQVRPDACVGEG